MKTAAEIRLEQNILQSRFNLLSIAPHLQAEAIARHYLAHANIAKQMMQLVDIKSRRLVNGQERITAILEMLAEEIKTNHAHDFGIQLEWVNLPKL